MREAIEIGYQAFVSDGGEEFGAVRAVWSLTLKEKCPLPCASNVLRLEIQAKEE